MQIILALLSFLSIAYCQDVCQQPNNVGVLCSGRNPRAYVTQKFYYDSVSNKCRSMVFAGCGGNNNKFNSLAECELQCQSIIPMPRDSSCGLNEVWDNCATSCPETCDNKPLDCTRECRRKCRCKDGFVLQDGKCVHRSQCAARDRNPNPKDQMIECNSDADCPPGEDCPQIFCIAPPCNKFCQKKETSCGQNEVFDKCASACPETCDGKPQFCTQQCSATCRCKDGFVLQDGKCVDRSECAANDRMIECNSEADCPRGEDCPQIFCIAPPCNKFCQKKITRAEACGANEVFDHCALACPETCDGVPSFCASQCEPGCRCKDGFVLQNGKCVDRSQCVPRDKNEGMIECNSDADCPPGEDCPQIFCVKAPCNKFCQKKATDSNESAQSCGANEVFDKCSPACPETCDGIPFSPICTLQCVAGCRCKPGYVLDSGVCKRRSQCPTKPRSQECNTSADCPDGQICPEIFCIRAPCPKLCMDEEEALWLD